MPISKRYNDVRIDSACIGYCSNRVLSDVRFLNVKFGCSKCNGNVMDNRIKFLLRFIGIKYNVGLKTIPIWLPILTLCRYGPIVKIASKIYYIILVKKMGWTKYDLTLTVELTICGCGPRLMILSNCYFVLLGRKLVGPNTFTIRRTI